MLRLPNAYAHPLCVCTYTGWRGYLAHLAKTDRNAHLTMVACPDWSLLELLHLLTCRFFETTPPDLINDGLYSTIAIALYETPHRKISLALAAQAMGAVRCTTIWGSKGRAGMNEHLPQVPEDASTSIISSRL